MSIVVKVPKKGDITQYDNSRGISLLSAPSKTLCRVLIDRVKSGVDEMIRSAGADRISIWKGNLEANLCSKEYP